MDLIESTVGFLLCGVFFTLFMFGIVTVQMYVYFRTFSKDPPMLRRLISIIWVLEVGTTLALTIGTYTIFVTNFGNIEKLVRTPNSLNCAALLGGMVDHLVKCIFIYRLYKFSSKLLIAMVLWGLSLFLFVIVVVVTIRAMRPIPLAPHSPGYEWQLSVIFVGSAVQDLCIAGNLCYYLRKQRRQAPKNTTLLLDKLFVYTIETAVATSLMAVAAAISYLSMKNTYVWMMFYLNMHTFFSNALLASLNNRAGLISPTDHISGDMTSNTQHDSITVHTNPVLPPLLLPTFDTWMGESVQGNMHNPGHSPTFHGPGFQGK